ncbi:M20 family metallopeptidase [Halolamina sp.]|jgi:acetylornithine deacetylase|uniref:M20 family metallopeptidase n=1 Tax=Halolamina sp. TaxID=1940283 RepID=UPI000223B982|nr:peptidase M20 [halophilic archaeon DL31]
MSDPSAELVDLTRDLVEIPSHEDETEAGDYLEAWLRAETDASVERDPAGNVLARRNIGAEESLALVGHHDVVPPADSQVRGDGRYHVEERDGRLHGRGTADMKGAVAAALLAFRDADPDTELQFASFVGEETDGEGVRAYLDRTTPDERFDYAVVGEGSTGYSTPGVTDVVVAHKGRRGSTLTATGRATHASLVEEGINAIYRASDAVDVVRNLDAPSATVLGEELPGSVAVTEIDGGSALNIIPEGCTVTVDERTVPGERADLGATEAVEGVTWTVDQDLPPMACSDEAFADAVLAAAREAAHAGEPAHVTKPHATDAGWLAAEGVTTVVAGPAESGEAHTDTESVAVDALTRCYRLYRSLAERL